MTELYFIQREKLYDKLENLIRSRTGAYDIARTENGKPYVTGNPVYFSVTHSGNRAAIALSDCEVGVDMEVYADGGHEGILSRFSERERAEITDKKQFLLHWTAREAYVKMLGATIWEYVKRLEYFGGDLYLDGEKLNVRIRTHKLGYGVACVCTKDGNL